MFRNVPKLVAIIALLSACSAVQAQQDASPASPAQAAAPPPIAAPPPAAQAAPASPAVASPAVASPAVAEPTAEQSEKPTRSAAIPHELSPWSMFMAADILVKSVMIGLVLASLATWTIFLAKTIEYAMLRRRLRAALLK